MRLVDDEQRRLGLARSASTTSGLVSCSGARNTKRTVPSRSASSAARWSPADMRRVELGGPAGPVLDLGEPLDLVALQGDERGDDHDRAVEQLARPPGRPPSCRRPTAGRRGCRGRRRTACIARSWPGRNSSKPSTSRANSRMRRVRTEAGRRRGRRRSAVGAAGGTDRRCPGRVAANDAVRRRSSRRRRRPRTWPGRARRAWPTSRRARRQPARPPRRRPPRRRCRGGRAASGGHCSPQCSRARRPAKRSLEEAGGVAGSQPQIAGQPGEHRVRLRDSVPAERELATVPPAHDVACAVCVRTSSGTATLVSTARLGHRRPESMSPKTASSSMAVSPVATRTPSSSTRRAVRPVGIDASPPP